MAVSPLLPRLPSVPGSPWGPGPPTRQQVQHQSQPANAKHQCCLAYLGVREGLGKGGKNHANEQIKAKGRIKATIEDTDTEITFGTRFPGDVAKVNYGFQLKQRKRNEGKSRWRK